MTTVLTGRKVEEKKVPSKITIKPYVEQKTKIIS